MHIAHVDKMMIISTSYVNYKVENYLFLCKVLIVINSNNCFNNYFVLDSWKKMASNMLFYRSAVE